MDEYIYKLEAKGIGWAIIGPDDVVATGHIYTDKLEAERLSVALIAAYRLGQRSNQPAPTAPPYRCPEPLLPVPKDSPYYASTGPWMSPKHVGYANHKSSLGLTP